MRGAADAANTGVLDGHARLHVGEARAVAGDAARALTLVGQAVTSNRYPHDVIAYHAPFLESLAGSAALDRVLAIAGRRAAEFRDRPPAP